MRFVEHMIQFYQPHGCLQPGTQDPVTLTTYRCRWPQLDLYHLRLQNSEVPATRETHT